MPRALVLLGLALAACTGTIGDSRGKPGSGPDGGAPCVPAGRNDEIRLALQRACAGCHTVGNRPFFASLEAFENGLVYDARLVTPGDPDHSLLIQMVKGQATGAYPQMPPGEKYDALLADGRATLSVADLEKWVRELPPPPARLEDPEPAAASLRRLTAEEMVVSLLDQLGLGVEDFIDTSRPTWRDEEWTVNGGKLFTWPTDWAPGISQQYVSDKGTTERFEALGGPVTLLYRRRDADLGPSAGATLVQVSQAWCKLAIEKAGNKAVLSSVTLSDKSATATPAIKANIRALFLRMLAQPATDAEVDDLFTQVYLPYETKSTKAAWTAVCASFVRHPLWLSF